MSNSEMIGFGLSAATFAFLAFAGFQAWKIEQMNRRERARETARDSRLALGE